MKLYNNRIFILVICILVSFNMLISSQAIEASSADNVKFETLSVQDGLPHSTVYSIVQDKYGYLWFGTGDGLSKYTGVDFITYRYDPFDPESLSGNIVRTIYEDSNGILWMGTDNGLSKYNRENDSFTRYLSDPDNNNTLSDQIVFSICEDNNHDLWIGTTIGLNKYNRENDSFTRYFNIPNDSNSLSGNFVYTICPDTKGNLWIGTNNGLNRYNERTNSFIRYFHDPNDPNSLSDNFCRVILEDNEGIVWIGTAAGLNRYDGMTDTFIRYYYEPNNLNSISYNTISYLYEDTKGNLWIGTSSNGLNKYHRETDSFIRYFSDADATNILSSNVIRVISEDSNGILWIGTYYGLNSFDEETGKVVSYTSENGLVNNTINGILEDQNGNLWVSTTAGLSKFNPAEHIFTNYGVGNNISSDEYIEQACFKSKTGELFFGGVNGLHFINPNIVETNTNPANVLITNLYTNRGIFTSDKPIEDINEVSLAHDDNTFTIEFATLDYISPFNNKYAYILEGFDDDWQYCNADKNFTKYTNIPSGEYNFKVIASNSDGIWNEEGPSLKIIIETPFWKEGWFILLLILFGIFTVLSIFKFKTRSLHKRAQELECQVLKRTALLKDKSDQLENELNKRAEFNRFLVHELKTPLTSLQLTNDVLMAHAQSQPFTSLAEGINKDITRLSHRVNELLDISRGEIGLLKLKRREVYLNKFFVMLKKDLALLVKSEGKILKFSIPEGLPVVLMDKERIVQVIYNLVDNALKYTFKNGIIVISADVYNNNFIVQVSDNGSGINSERLYNIFDDSHHQTNADKRHGGFGLGLSLSKLLIELHGGHIWVDSEVAKGSTFGFSIPINN